MQQVTNRVVVCSQSSLSVAPEGKPCRQSALFQLAEVGKMKDCKNDVSNSLVSYADSKSEGVLPYFMSCNFVV